MASELERYSGEVERLEAELAGVRRRRDAEVVRVARASSERHAAALSGLAPSYVHRLVAAAAPVDPFAPVERERERPADPEPELERPADPEPELERPADPEPELEPEREPVSELERLRAMTGAAARYSLHEILGAHR